ncbi:hypothetical protein FBU30_004570 [Linnemannia zychae]|nr:hypothetical protein FBU30_004570 [Linnemannia zychae]
MSYNYAKVAASDQELGYHYDSIQPCDQPSTPSWTTIPITTDPLVSTTMNTTASSARADIPNRGSENDDTNSTQQSHLQQSLYVIPMTPPSHSSSLHTQYRHSPLYQQQQQHQQHRSSPSHRPNSTASSRSVRSSPVPDGGFVDKGWKSVQSLREIILTSMPFVPSTLRPYTLLSDESIQNNGGSVSSFTASTLSSSPTMDLPCSSSSNSNSSSSGSGSAPNRMQSAIQSSIRPANPVDGVFSNISAKPEVEGQKDDERHPPAYESAVQDITPPYFEMTVQSPLSTGDEGSVFGDEILINGLPVGNFFQFLWNITGT